MTAAPQCPGCHMAIADLIAVTGYRSRLKYQETQNSIQAAVTELQLHCGKFLPVIWARWSFLGPCMSVFHNLNYCPRHRKAAMPLTKEN